jgi:hypothetical protein
MIRLASPFRRDCLVPAFVLAALALACKPAESGDDATTVTTNQTSGIMTGGVETSTSGGQETMGPKLDIEAVDDTGPDCTVEVCPGAIDLLFVIDNSGSMSEEQLNLALNLPGLIQGLENLEDSQGMPIGANVNIMVTTTDNGNPLCTQFYKPGRMPEQGAPISTPCTDRLDRFTGIGAMPLVVEDVCTSNCPAPIAPDDDFINFSPEGTNVPDAAPVDVNGDGVDDSNVAQALACIGPQGIDGCGHESPLQTMRLALDADAEWNQGDTPFLRSEGVLAVAIVTDEVECSIADGSVMSDQNYMEIEPGSMMPIPSSAICWNAGVMCDGPDGMGVYTNCQSYNDRLRPVQEYIDFLQAQPRPVVMLGIIGVPEVTEYNDQPPFEPIAGGVLDLVYRTWQDGEYPGGDILPDEWAAGKDAADKEWEFGIGPGCTGEDGMGGFTGQATPNTRVIEVCQALDIEDDPMTLENEKRVRCCIESICDTDFSNALTCLTGIVEVAVG